MRPTRAQLERQIERAERHLDERMKAKAPVDTARAEAVKAVEAGEFTLRQAVLADFEIGEDLEPGYLRVAGAFALVPVKTLTVFTPFLHVAAYPPGEDPPDRLAANYTEMWEEYLDHPTWTEEWSAFFRGYYLGMDNINAMAEYRSYLFHLLVYMGDNLGTRGRERLWEKFAGEWRIRPAITKSMNGEQLQAVKFWTELIERTRNFDGWPRHFPTHPDPGF